MKDIHCPHAAPLCCSGSVVVTEPRLHGLRAPNLPQPLVRKMSAATESPPVVAAAETPRVMNTRVARRCPSLRLSAENDQPTQQSAEMLGRGTRCILRPIVFTIYAPRPNGVEGSDQLGSLRSLCFWTHNKLFSTVHYPQILPIVKS